MEFTTPELKFIFDHCDRYNVSNSTLPIKYNFRRCCILKKSTLTCSFVLASPCQHRHLAYSMKMGALPKIGDKGIVARCSPCGMGDAKVTQCNTCVYGEHCKNRSFCFIAKACAINPNRKTEWKIIYV